MISGAKRNPVRTRQLLLDSAFREVHRAGFQGSDLDTILHSAGVTKGALYHHFESKEALGYALVDEVIAGIMRTKWLQPLEASDDPIGALIRIVQGTGGQANAIRCGCPLNNLAQEMSPLDEGFRTRLAKVFADWLDGIAAALRRGQRRGLVRPDLEPLETATFLVATYEGYISLAKNAQDDRVLESGRRAVVKYLESLKTK
jgi:AcrR family transcriptional regulator